MHRLAAIRQLVVTITSGCSARSTPRLLPIFSATSSHCESVLSGEWNSIRSQDIRRTSQRTCVAFYRLRCSRRHKQLNTFIVLFMFLISLVHHHHPALLHHQALILDRLLTSLMAFSALALKLSFYQSLSVRWCNVVQITQAE